MSIHKHTCTCKLSLHIHITYICLMKTYCIHYIVGYKQIDHDKVQEYLSSVNNSERTITAYNVPSHSPSYPEPLCWLLSLEGGGRYLHDLYMKQSEEKCIHPDTTIRENQEVKRRRRDYKKKNSKINNQTYIFAHIYS